MKCLKCKTELFYCDIVNEIERVLTPKERARLHPSIGSIMTHEIYRCPKCFTTQKIKVEEE